jgi:hypothetical protein
MIPNCFKAHTAAKITPAQKSRFRKAMINPIPTIVENGNLSIDAPCKRKLRYQKKASRLTRGYRKREEGKGKLNVLYASNARDIASSRIQPLLFI